MKFDGILLCTDLDDTLLTSEKTIQKKDIEALAYFMDNGGKYTFATGRVPAGALLVRKFIEPNTPMVCYNGGAIYDFKSERFLWRNTLPENAIEVIEYVDKFLPYAGIEASTEDEIYFNKVNHLVAEHKTLEKFPDNYCDYHDIKKPLMKVIFMVEEYQMKDFKDAVAKTDFPSHFSFIQSSPWYYELLPYGSSKGNGLGRLKEITGSSFAIGMGDNENDISLVCDADLGVAVQNASEAVKSSADITTKNDHNHCAVSELISYLEHSDILNGVH